MVVKMFNCYLVRYLSLISRFQMEFLSLKYVLFEKFFSLYELIRLTFKPSNHLLGLIKDV